MTFTAPANPGQGAADLSTPGNAGRGLVNFPLPIHVDAGPPHPRAGILTTKEAEMKTGRIPGAGSPATAGKCVVCGQPYSIACKSGPEAPVPYTKNNKTGFAHTRCVKGDKPNAPRDGGQGERGK